MGLGSIYGRDAKESGLFHTNSVSSILTCHAMFHRMSRFKKILPNFKSLSLESEVIVESFQSDNCDFTSSFNHLNKWLSYFPFSDHKLYIPTIIIIVINATTHIMCVCLCVHILIPKSTHLMPGHVMSYNFIQLNFAPCIYYFRTAMMTKMLP